MTALKEYDRLEATALWRPTPQDQRREVVVSVGDATLTISDMKDRPLAHWSLAAVERLNPGERPAIYSPDGDSGETLEIATDEQMMINAIEKLRRAVANSRVRPGRLRGVTIGVSAVAFGLIGLFWLPQAMLGHATRVVPAIKRQEIGAAMLGRIERVAGKACQTEYTDPVLDRLAKRTGIRRIIVLRTGVRDSLLLPGGVVLLNKAIIEDHEDPAVAAGYILAERARAQEDDPLGQLLRAAGPLASFQLLTTGDLSPETLDHYAEGIMTAPRTQAPDAAQLALFEATKVPSTPYAYARDITGESVLGLIEADPMAGQSPPPVLRDRDWVLLQNICGG